jgi:cytochrome c biogenesis protein CcmG/thiol:disulfide interchange protein DsbE
MHVHLPRTNPARTAALLLALAAAAAGQPGTHAALEPPKQRKPAPGFTLQDSSGKTVQLADYRGKVVLLDFWATWCHGCKQEIPWFAEFEKAYRGQGLAVVGVSMDDGGWNVVRPFLAATHVPYRMLLGNDAMAKRYGIGNLPDTFLIDRQGRIAAVYKEGLVDKNDVEANIKAMLSQQ